MSVGLARCVMHVCKVSQSHTHTQPGLSIRTFPNLRGQKINANFFGTKFFRSRPGKPNQRKGQNEKFMNFAHFCEFWCFSLGKQARFTLNCCSGMPLRKVHELTSLWFGLPGPLLSFSTTLRVMDVRTEIVDVRAKRCVFLRPRWWGASF